MPGGERPELDTRKWYPETPNDAIIGQQALLLGFQEDTVAGILLDVAEGCCSGSMKKETLGKEACSHVTIVFLLQQKK